MSIAYHKNPRTSMEEILTLKNTAWRGSQSIVGIEARGES